MSTYAWRELMEPWNAALLADPELQDLLDPGAVAGINAVSQASSNRGMDGRHKPSQ